MIRMPAVAGLFYPESGPELAKMVENFLSNARHQPEPVRALIVPHAGLVYSGPFAAEAFAVLRGQTFRRVLLLGPSHRIAFTGLALSSAKAFATPLGALKVDQSARADLLDLPYVQIFDPGHLYEHCLEVQLPFLQCCLPEAMIIPIVIGHADPGQVAQVIDRLADDSTLILISSDLSHYHDDATARSIDQETGILIENLAYQKLNGERACGYQGIAGLLHYAKRHDLTVATVALGHSGDTAGDQSRVVGYGAFIVG